MGGQPAPALDTRETAPRLLPATHVFTVPRSGAVSSPTSGHCGTVWPVPLLPLPGRGVKSCPQTPEKGLRGLCAGARPGVALGKCCERLSWARVRGLLWEPRGRWMVPPGPNREGGMVPRITVRISCRTRVEKTPWRLAFGCCREGTEWQNQGKDFFPPCALPSVRAEEEQKASERGDWKSSGVSECGVISVAVSQRGGCCRLCLTVAVTSTRSAV